MSMISPRGAIRFITPWQVPTRSSGGPKSVRTVINRGGSLPGGALDRRNEAVEVVLHRLGDDAEPCGLRSAGRLRADRDRGEIELERRESLSCRGGGENDEVAVRRLLGAERNGAVERHEIRVVLAGEIRACAVRR